MFGPSLMRLFGRKTQSSRTQGQPAPRPLQLEALDERLVMNAHLNQGNLMIIQTNASDVAVVEYTSTGDIKVTDNGVVKIFDDAKVNRIVYYGLGGDDVFVNNTDVRALAFGGAGGDDLFGGSNSDLLEGGSGDDTLDGREGRDKIRGEEGNDILRGGSENDELFGGTGFDRLDGGSGADYLDAGSFDGSADVLTGGSGADYFVRYDPSFVDIVTDFTPAQGDLIEF